MINEKAKEQIEKQLESYDRMFDQVEETEEEFELEGKPSKEHKFYPVFARSYHLKLANLYYMQKYEGEDAACKEAEEKLDDVMNDLKEGLDSKKYHYYFDCLGYAWACKDYKEGED